MVQFPRRVDDAQDPVCQVPTHLLGVEAAMFPLVGVVTAAELSGGSGGEDGRVIGAELGVYDDPAVKGQEGGADGPEGIVVDSSVGEVDEELREEDDVIKRQPMKSITTVVVIEAAHSTEQTQIL